MNQEIEYLKKQSSIIVNLYNAKKYEEAVIKGKTLIKKFPTQIVFYNATALSLSAIGKYDDALQILNSALIQSPNNISVLNNLGLVNKNVGNNALSREYLNKTLSINENFIDALLNLGSLDLHENKIEDAKKNLTKALSLSKASNTDEIINMAIGNLNQQIGNFDDSLKNFQIVSKINPLNTNVDKSISTMHKYKDKKDPHLVSMEKKLKIIKNKDDLQPLYFALGKAYEDLNEYKESFKYIKLGNSVVNKKINYNLQNDKNLFNHIKFLFENLDKKEIIESKTKIIFILGMPRSGTTLTEQIISSHNKVHGAGELNYMSDAIEKVLHNTEISNNKKNSKNKNWSNFIKLKNIDKDQFKKIQISYEEDLNQLSYDKPIITDKAPLNFRWIGFIKTVFPNSKIIHCNRNSMDICFSNFKNSFSSNSLGFCYDLKNLGNYFNLYKDLMSFWNSIYKDEIYQLTYENLISNKENEVKKLLKFCDLDWDENCLNPQNNKKAVATASLAQVRTPIYKTSIAKWKNLEEELIELKEIIKKN